MTKLEDLDLLSIQSARDKIKSAKEAQKIIATYSQEQVDILVKAVSEETFKYAAELGIDANEETGFGKACDKKIKNIFASVNVYDYIKDMKTVGILNEDKENKLVEIAVPVGVIAGLIPSTNPTSTVIYKAMIALKAGNAIVFSPHPGAIKCITKTVNIIRDVLAKNNAPVDLVSVLEYATISATSELMKHDDISLILATGGSAMVKSAYSSGTPAIGVGPGNGPAFIEKSADIELAVKRIIDSKTFDNGTICASEQSIICEKSIEDEVIKHLKMQKAYFLNAEEKVKIESILMRPNGTMNPKTVGKSASYIASLAGLTIPKDTSVIIGLEDRVSEKVPFSKEKLCPVLAFYVEPTWERACERAIEILTLEGQGHTMMIHSKDEAIIREFALKKPVNRLLINTSGALGGIGATTGLAPALTLGCGAVGGSSTSDNITPMHLLNIRRATYGIRELQDIKNSIKSLENGTDNNQCYNSSINEDYINNIVKKTILEVLKNYE